MKRIHLICVLFSYLLTSLSGYAQAPFNQQYSFEEVLTLAEEQSKKGVDEFIQEKIKFDRWDPEYDILKIEFTSDTLFIEGVELSLIDLGRYTTLDMRSTNTYKEKKYDELLNKYYRVVMNALPSEQKEQFRNAQRLWLKYRDSENELDRELILHGAYGGGTMGGVMLGTRRVERIKQRVVYFYQLMGCI